MAFHSIPRKPSIWATVEMSAASMDFSYSDYCDLHAKSLNPAAVLSASSYALINQILNNSINESMLATELRTN
jgi:hypothetical protein